MRRLGAVALACGVLLGSVSAQANGRFPRSQRLVIDPGDPTHMVLAGTFGLAITRDGGEDWIHVCEAAFAEPNAILDPLVGFSQDRKLYTGTLLDLRQSDEALCEFDVVLGEPTELVPDYTFDADGSSLLAITSGSTDGKDVAQIQWSADGRAWSNLGAAIENRAMLTLDVAPSDPDRLYATALAPDPDPDAGGAQQGILLRSADRGETWEELVIEGTSFDAQPFIAAMHPTDPDTLFVRLSAIRLNDFDLPVANDTLLVSRDGGETWQERLRKAARLFAFAISPDGLTMLAGFGVPDNSEIDFLAADYGLYRMPVTDSGEDPEHLLEGIPVQCLTWTDEKLFVCLKQFEAGFELGVTQNFDFRDLDELEPMLLLNEVTGPRNCPGDTEAAACAGLWETSCSQLFACEQGTTQDAGSDVDNSTVDAQADASTEAPSEVAPEVEPEQTVELQRRASEGSCNCRVPRSDAGLRATALWLLIVGVVLGRRRDK